MIFPCYKIRSSHSFSVPFKKDYKIIVHSNKKPEMNFDHDIMFVCDKNGTMFLISRAYFDDDVNMLYLYNIKFLIKPLGVNCYDVDVGSIFNVEIPDLDEYVIRKRLAMTRFNDLARSLNLTMYNSPFRNLYNNM